MICRKGIGNIRHAIVNIRISKMLDRDYMEYCMLGISKSNTKFVIDYDTWNLAINN